MQPDQPDPLLALTAGDSAAPAPGPVPVWPRPNRTGAADARARQHYIAFFPEEGADVAVSAAVDGLPAGDPLAPFKVEAYDDAAWVAGWSAGPLGAFLDDAPDVDAASVRACRAAMAAWANVPDPLTLGPLQGGMALCKAFGRAGAVAVLDVVALRWWGRDALAALPPGRGFDVHEHITVTFETEAAHPEVGHLCHTRGMAKFARPDLGIHVAGPHHAADAGRLLNGLAAALALGLAPAPGDTTRVAGTVVRLAGRPDDAGLPAPLFFNRWFELQDPKGGVAPFPWA
jgi:hypothetical protein